MSSSTEIRHNSVFSHEAPHTTFFFIVNKSVLAASRHVSTALIFTHLHDDSVLLILNRILCTKKELVEDTDT